MFASPPPPPGGEMSKKEIKMSALMTFVKLNLYDSFLDHTILPLQAAYHSWTIGWEQGYKFSGNCLNSGFHEVQTPALLFIFALDAFSPDSHTFSGFFFQVSLHPCGKSVMVEKIISKCDEFVKKNNNNFRYYLPRSCVVTDTRTACYSHAGDWKNESPS